MAHNRDMLSPTRSPRRSPRLSLRALQMSQSPTKSTGAGLFFGSTTPFQQAPPLQHSTPFQQPVAAQPVPPSTGLSRFACLQNLASNNRPPETPSNRVLSLRFTEQTPILPSPFVSTGLFTAPMIAAGQIAAVHESPSRAASGVVRTPSPAKQTPSPRKQSDSFKEQPSVTRSAIRNVSPSKVTFALGTPSVRYFEPEPHTSLTQTMHFNTGVAARHPARSSSPVKTQAEPTVARTPERQTVQPELQASSTRKSVKEPVEMPATPPSAPVASDAKPETPGPVFRQTARRVPIQQHEAEFGVKVSPEKPLYSPRKGYANSSARSNDFGAKPERIPARRVQVQQPAAARQVSAKQSEQPTTVAPRVASVASKAARTASTGTSRIGGQSAILPAAALSRPVVGVSKAPASSTSASIATRVASSSQPSSVASKANRLQRPASAVFGSKPASPSKQARTLSGLPRPKSATATAMSVPATGLGSRLPRPASASAAQARLESLQPLPPDLSRWRLLDSLQPNKLPIARPRALLPANLQQQYLLWPTDPYQNLLLQLCKRLSRMICRRWQQAQSELMLPRARLTHRSSRSASSMTQPLQSHLELLHPRAEFQQRRKLLCVRQSRLHLFVKSRNSRRAN